MIPFRRKRIKIKDNKLMNEILLNPVTLAVSSSMNLFEKVLFPLYWVFGKAMGFLMDLLNNEYFLAIVIFTVVTRLILLPLNIRQQRTTAKTARLQPKIQKIQNKYANVKDPQARVKMNEEMQELYTREGHNPMQMGCGPMLFQMLFLMGIVGIIYYPLNYVIGMSGINDYSKELMEFVQGIGYKGAYLQLGILENWAGYKEQLIAAFPQLFTDEAVSSIEAFRSGMYIGGLDMTAIPHWKDGKIVIIPIVSFLTSFLSTIVSTLIQKKNNPAASQQMGQMLMMSLMMPFFSLYIAFKVPAAVGFYWIISNVVAVLQQLFIAKFYPPKRSQARVMIENTIERRSRENSIKRIKK